MKTIDRICMVDEHFSSLFLPFVVRVKTRASRHKIEPKNVIRLSDRRQILKLSLNIRAP